MRLITPILVITLLFTAAFANESFAQKKPANKPAASAPIGPEISESDAIKIAEQFIVDNGYTDLPAIQDKTKITPEVYDFLGTHEQIMKLRHNSLSRKAYGVTKHKRDNLPGWAVIFTRTPNDQFDATNGRTVIMELDGSRPHIDPKEWSLNSADKKLKDN